MLVRNRHRVMPDVSAPIELSISVRAYLTEASCVLTLLKNVMHCDMSGIDSNQLYEYSRPNIVGLIPRR